MSIMDTLAAIQNGGGMLVVFAYLVFEVRQLRIDFNRHEATFHKEN